VGKSRPFADIAGEWKRSVLGVIGNLALGAGATIFGQYRELAHSFEDPYRALSFPTPPPGKFTLELDVARHPAILCRDIID
jgi:hypothetical protein